MENEKNFKFLSQKITDTQGKLILNEDIKLSGGLLSPEKRQFKEGIKLKNDDYIIDGKGHSIDADGKTRIFDIMEGKKVILENIVFKNGNADYGGALRNAGKLELINCKFENNNAKKHGCDISNTPKGEVKIFNCEFSPKSDAIWNRNLVRVWESQFDETKKFITGGRISTYGLGNMSESEYGSESYENKIRKLHSKRFDVYICFDSNDFEIARELYEYLENNRVKCWILKKENHDEEKYAKKTIEAINDSKNILLIYSKNTQKSDEVRREIYYAAVNGIHIFPFIVDDSDIVGELAFIISSHDWIFLNKEDKESSFKKIVEILKTIKTLTDKVL